ncbi:hypothetical protein FE782_18970 [Paenibacillus antri]|uniref:Sulfatase N-terminal domain-containing protein n=1 Tax=Paenibacillus antri TaxID=2582848 RepID=A0A5R9G9L9_9BACL|nr:LTA synthase family protein [Paenibacillus antri]TLS50780.1 hypothetical protein FE782_18970 [Paenibacillus antri]
MKTGLFLLMLVVIIVSGCSEHVYVEEQQVEPVAVIESVNNAEEVDAVESHANRPNIIAIQLEAFQTFVLNRSVRGTEITPNLNELIRDSAYFSNFYLQNGGGSTSDAEFMMNTSLHPFKFPQSVAVDAADKRFPSLPRLLGAQGYHSTTLHVNNVMFWNRKNFYSALGFDSYYDKAYFGLEDLVASGSSDRVLFEKGMDVLETLDQPFYAQFVTMSSHYPYSLPKNMKSMKLPEVYEGNLVGNYLHAVHYVDAAIGEFIEALKANDLWDNTILVLYGDHSGLQMKFVKEQEEAALEDFLGRAYDKVDALQVPFIIHGSGATAGEHTMAGGHLDMLPTVLPLLGLRMDTPVFGFDLFTNADHPVAIRSSFAEEGTFVYRNVLYDAADGSLLSIETREAPMEAAFNVEEEKQRQLQRFRQSDDIVRALPTKDDSFGTDIELTEPSDVYESPEDPQSIVASLPAGTVITTFRQQGEWYSFYDDDGKEHWVRTLNPIQEVFKLVELPHRAKLFSEPNERLKPRLEIGKQTLYALKEWKGTGWYQVSTWLGEELWIQIAP